MQKNVEKIAEIKKHAQREVRIIRSIQRTISDTIEDYMKKNKIDFTKLFTL